MALANEWLKWKDRLQKPATPTYRVPNRMLRQVGERAPARLCLGFWRDGARRAAQAERAEVIAAVYQAEKEASRAIDLWDMFRSVTRRQKSVLVYHNSCGDVNGCSSCGDGVVCHVVMSHLREWWVLRDHHPLL
jgi:hypothetical protein